MKFKKEREEDKIDGCELFFIVVHFSHDIFLFYDEFI
jgi:hypothetical protein